MLTPTQIIALCNYTHEDARGLEEIADAVLASEALIVSGSSLTRLSAKKSVLDLHILGHAEKRPVTCAASLMGATDASYRLSSGRIIIVRYTDVEILTDIQNITQRYHDSLSLPAALVKPAEFSLAQQILLHEIRDGMTLRNESIVEIWREKLRVMELPTYIAIHKLQIYAARRANSEQFANVGEMQSALWCLREAQEELLAAYLASFGLTNPRKRWHMKLLQVAAETHGARNALAFQSMLLAALGECTQTHFRQCKDCMDAVLREIVERLPVLTRITSLLHQRASFLTH